MQVPASVMQTANEASGGTQWMSTAVTFLVACSICLVISAALFEAALRRQIAVTKQQSRRPHQPQQPKQHSADAVEDGSLVGQIAADPVAVAVGPQALTPELQLIDDTMDTYRADSWGNDSDDTLDAVTSNIMDSPLIIAKPLTSIYAGDLLLPTDNFSYAAWEHDARCTARPGFAAEQQACC